jgi:hypothetical protein
VPKLPVLPTFYYLDHFVEMLAFVQKTYGSILADEHLAFVARFEVLSKDAQCLLIRMVNRRGAIFNGTLFSYPEIEDVELAAAELTAIGHARALEESDYTAFVACLPKDVLMTGAQAAGRGDVRKSWSKPQFVDYYLEQIPFSVAAQHCGARCLPSDCDRRRGIFWPARSRRRELDSHRYGNAGRGLRPALRRSGAIWRSPPAKCHRTDARTFRSCWSARNAG